MNIKPATIEEEIKQFIKAWGDAWSPQNQAPLFNRCSLTPFYIQSEEFLAFDSTEAGKRTVIRGTEAHADMWEPFVQSYKFWTFTPVMDSLKVYPQSSNGAGAILFVDNYGVRPNGEEFKFRAHVTILLEKHDDRITTGTTIAILDDADQKLAVAQAKARLAQERSNLARLEVGTRARNHRSATSYSTISKS